MKLSYWLILFSCSCFANLLGLNISLVTILWLLFRKNYSWAGWLFIWAILVSYSRVHVGVHYPGDILVGGLVGWVVGLLFYRIYLIFKEKYSIGID